MLTSKKFFAVKSHENLLKIFACLNYICPSHESDSFWNIYSFPCAVPYNNIHSTTWELKSMELRNLSTNIKSFTIKYVIICILKLYHFHRNRLLNIHDIKIIFFQDLYSTKHFMFKSKVYLISLRQPKDYGNILQNFIFRTLSDYLLNTFHPCHTLKHQS